MKAPRGEHEYSDQDLLAVTRTNIQSMSGSKLASDPILSEYCLSMSRNMVVTLNTSVPALQRFRAGFKGIIKSKTRNATLRNLRSEVATPSLIATRSLTSRPPS
jgi:hypothetical protein